MASPAIRNLQQDTPEMTGHLTDKQFDSTDHGQLCSTTDLDNFDGTGGQMFDAVQTGW
jgi:hypothetical protein